MVEEDCFVGWFGYFVADVWGEREHFRPSNSKGHILQDMFISGSLYVAVRVGIGLLKT